VRVAHFCDSHPGRADGVSRSAALTVALLREAGHEVDDFRPGPLLGRRAAGEVRSVPVPVRRIRVALPPRRVTGPADVVHVHTTGPIGMAGFRFAAEHGRPLVVTWHTDLLAYADHFVEIPIGAVWCARQLRLGWTLREHLELAHRGEVRHRRLLALGRGMVGRMAVAIAPSPKAAAGLAVFGELPEVRVLPTPVPAGPPIATAGSATATAGPATGTAGPATGTAGSATGTAGSATGTVRDAGGPVVLSVGRATPEKNPVLLLEAFAHVVARRPDARLILLGVQRGHRSVRRRAGALGIADRVRMLPPVPHDLVTGYYRSADVLAFAATTDTQSLVLSEAEAAGLPVVVADRALAERPGDPGPPRVTCDPTPESFAAGLLGMLDDAGLRERTARAGLAATASYPPQRYLSLLLAAYEQARDAVCDLRPSRP
jgi:1,2-diacylglycerol 3-alpha-glucosyltransferase